MKKVSIHELKQDLSSFVAAASAGEEILITRHNRPMARLTSAERQHLHQGSRFDRAILRPVLHGQTRGRYLILLEEDRCGGRDNR